MLFRYFVHCAVFQKQNISENGLVSVLSSFCWSEFSRCLIELQKTDLVSRMLCCFLEYYVMEKAQNPSNHIYILCSTALNMLMFQARRCKSVTDHRVSSDLAWLGEMHQNSHDSASQCKQRIWTNKKEPWKHVENMCRRWLS